MYHRTQKCQIFKLSNLANKWAIVVTKPTFLGSEKVRFKIACSATETSQKTEISPVASLEMVLFQQANNKGADQTAQTAGWSAPFLFADPSRQVILC